MTDGNDQFPFAFKIIFKFNGNQVVKDNQENIIFIKVNYITLYIHSVRQ